MDLAQLPTSTNGYNYILVIIDVCTRLVFLRALKVKDAPTIAKKLFKLFCDVGWPRIWQSDNGTEFKNSVLKEMKKLSGADHRFITAYNPRANGITERFVGTAKKTLLKMLHADLSEWEKHVPQCQYLMNIKVTALTNSTPFSLFYARRFNQLANYQQDDEALMTEQELQERLEHLTNIVYPSIAERSIDIQEKRKAKFDEDHMMLNLPMGAQVMTITHRPKGKAEAQYEGPFKVVRRNAGGAYTLRDSDGEVLQRDYAPHQLKLITADVYQGDNDEASYVIKKILDDRVRQDGQREYLVHWKGYTKEEATWTAYEDFNDVEIIRKYHANLPNTNT